MKTLSLTRPDDWHVHFRDAEALQTTVPATSATFARALLMPNLTPALTTLPTLLAYRARVQEATPDNTLFEPYFSFYLNTQTPAADLVAAKAHPFILGAKLYPANVTTNASEGVQAIQTLYPLLDLMSEQDLVLQVHGERLASDIFDREAAFISETLIPLTKAFPRLRVVLEHISTQVAVDYVLQAPNNIAATITPHHLRYHRNDLLSGGIKPHLYCLPILKRQTDQQALIQAACSGNPKFFAGTDSAPHPIHQKESACGCAGIFSAPYAVSLYAECFEKAQKLSLLEGFMSHYGADFYQLPRNTQTITLIQQPQTIPLHLPYLQSTLVPIAAGESISWRTLDES